MAKRLKIDNGFYVKSAGSLIYGKKNQTNSIEKNIGSNYGFMRAIQSASYVTYLGTANPNYIALKTTGSKMNRQKVSILQSANILFTMELTSIETGV